MPNLMFYATSSDMDTVRRWINAESDVSWIVKDGQSGNTYSWKLVDQIDTLTDRHQYTIWNRKVGPIRVPPANLKGAAAVVLDPYKGWSYTLDCETTQTPWLGEDHKDAIQLWFAETSELGPNYLARSGFSWIGDRYRIIGRGAHPEVARWWSRLKRFVKRNSVQIRWPEDLPGARLAAHVFPEALSQCQKGKQRNPNPG